MEAAKKDDELSSDEEEDFDTLKVYIYHGSSRRADPSFIAEFDVVITSYNTLAQEFSKMSAVAGEDETASATPVETAGNSEDDAAGMDGLMEAGLNTRQTKPDVEAEIKASEVVDALRRPKGKKKGRPVPSRAQSRSARCRRLSGSASSLTKLSECLRLRQDVHGLC